MCLVHKRIKFLCNRSHHDSDDKGFPGDVDLFFFETKDKLFTGWFHWAVGMTDFIQFRSASPVIQC